MENKTPETSGKAGSFMKLLSDHGTTVIAIMMTLITMQAENIDALRDDADFLQEQTEERRTNFEDEISDVTDTRDEMSVIYEDTNSEGYTEGMQELAEKETVLNDSLELLQNEEAQQEVLLATADDKEEKSNWAEGMSELAILLSATGTSSKKRILQFAAGAMTIVALLLVGYTFMV